MRMSSMMLLLLLLSMSSSEDLLMTVVVLRLTADVLDALGLRLDECSTITSLLLMMLLFPS